MVTMTLLDKTFKFFHPERKPSANFDGCQYLLFIDWLPVEDRDDDYCPSYFIGIWEDDKWWTRDTSHEPCGDTFDEDEPGIVLRPILFTPLREWDILLGWCPLFACEER
jgi:hypothetical protein